MNVKRKNIIFLQDRFSPDVEFYGWNKRRERNYLTVIKAVVTPGLLQKMPKKCPGEFPGLVVFFSRIFPKI